MSKDLLSILAKKENYERFTPFIKEHTIGKEEAQIIKDMADFYQNHEEIKWAEFRDWFKFVQHPMYNHEKQEVYTILFDGMDGYTPSAITDQIIEKYICQDFCVKISDKSLRGADGETIDLDDIVTLVEEYNAEVGRATKLEEFTNTETIEEIVKRQHSTGLEWAFPCLNKSIGLLTQAKLTCLGARPNIGKTTFLGKNVCTFLKQLPPEKTIVWLNNEEEEGSVKKRIVQCGINWLSSEIDARPIEAVLEFEKKWGKLDRIKVVNAVSFSFRDCEAVFKLYNPGVIIFDQLRNMRTNSTIDASLTQKQEVLFSWAREQAKTYAPVVTVHQLKAEAEGTAYPLPSMLYWSGTAIQGAVDTLLMLGRDYTDPLPGLRYLSVVKTKEAFGPDVDPSLSEGKFELEMVGEYADLKEL